MKQGWEIKQWNEVLEIRSGRNQKEVLNPNGKYPIIGSAGKIMGYADKYICEEGTTIIGRKGTINSPLFIEHKFWNVDTAFGLHSMDILNNIFLHYFCLSFDFTELDKGSGRPSLVKSDLLKIQIPLPPLPEQQRIVAILDQAFAAIEKAKTNAQQNLRNAKQLFESYLQGVFENKGDDWEETLLKNEIDLATGFAFKSKYYTTNEDDILLLRGDNIMQGDFRWKDSKRWNKSEYDDFEKYQLQENDIVLAMDRPWVKAGLKCARVSKSELPSLLVQRTARLRNNSQLDNSFLYFLIQSKGFTDYLIDIQTGIGVPHISGKQILSFPFRKPHLKEQQQIVKKLNSLSAETKKLEGIYQQKTNDLEELKKSVLNKAFKGEL